MAVLNRLAVLKWSSYGAFLFKIRTGCPAIREIREIREKSGNLVVVWKSQGKIREKRPFLRSQGKLKKYEKKIREIREKLDFCLVF